MGGNEGGGQITGNSMVQASGSKGKIAWCVSPILSGVTTVYNVVGAGLRRAGWEVLAVTTGADGCGEPAPGSADKFLEVLLPGRSDVRQNAAEFVRWVVERQIDVVLHGADVYHRRRTRPADSGEDHQPLRKHDPPHLRVGGHESEQNRQDHRRDSTTAAGLDSGLESAAGEVRDHSRRRRD